MDENEPPAADNQVERVAVEPRTMKAAAARRHVRFVVEGLIGFPPGATQALGFPEWRRDSGVAGEARR
jgi:hypothetical protein